MSSLRSSYFGSNILLGFLCFASQYPKTWLQSSPKLWIPWLNFSKASCSDIDWTCSSRSLFVKCQWDMNISISIGFLQTYTILHWGSSRIESGKEAIGMWIRISHVNIKLREGYKFTRVWTQQNKGLFLITHLKWPHCWNNPWRFIFAFLLFLLSVVVFKLSQAYPSGLKWYLAALIISLYQQLIDYSKGVEINTLH